MSCPACQSAEESILTHKEHRAGCLSCAARALAQVYGDYPAELVRQPMSQMWKDTKTFSKGRSLYWAWVKVIKEAKEKA